MTSSITVLSRSLFTTTPLQIRPNTDTFLSTLIIQHDELFFDIGGWLGRGFTLATELRIARLDGWMALELAEVHRTWQNSNNALLFVRLKVCKRYPLNRKYK